MSSVVEFPKGHSAERDHRGGGAASAALSLPSEDDQIVGLFDDYLREGADAVAGNFDPARVYMLFLVSAAKRLSDMRGPKVAGEYLARLAAATLGRIGGNDPEAA